MLAHVGDYSFVINNYTLPKDNSKKDRWKVQTGPELTRTPKSANNSAAVLASPWLFAKAAEPKLTSPLNGRQGEVQVCMLQPPRQGFKVLLHPLDIQLNDF